LAFWVPLDNGRCLSASGLKAERKSTNAGEQIDVRQQVLILPADK
jgi:hypothetical protein